MTRLKTTPEVLEEAPAALSGAGRRPRRRFSLARPEELPTSKPTRMEDLLQSSACPSASRAIWHPSCLDLPSSEEASDYHYMLSTLMSGEPIPSSMLSTKLPLPCRVVLRFSQIGANKTRHMPK